MRHRLAQFGLFAAVLLFAGMAHAQGIECSRARSPTEKAICASPALLALDHQVAVAYADTLARRPDQRDAIRADLLRWLRQRDAACNVRAAAMERCLSGQLTARLAALTPAPTPAAAPAPQTPSPQEEVRPGTPAVQAALPDKAVPPVSDNPPAPAATLEAASVPAAAESDTLLHVTSPGRFALAAHSPSGAGLQLVDMLTGPSETAGAAGAQDGRLDRLLDVGTYKLRVFSAPGASGTVSLTVTPFHDAAPAVALPRPDHPLATTLKDGEQRAFWVLVPPGAANVRIEAAGRSLGDLRLWRNGRELTALAPERLRVEPTPGHPLDDLRLAGGVEPGTYLAVAYGGPPATWTDGAADQPFHLRSGVSGSLAEGWAGGTMGPFGSEVFDIPPASGMVRLDLPAAAAAELHVGGDVAVLAKNSREPTVQLERAVGAGVAEVRAAAGQAYTLRALEMPTAQTIERAGTWWVSAATTGMGGDEVPPTLLLRRSEQADQPLRIIASTAPRVGPGALWHARFNLRGPTDLLLQLPSGGDIGFSSTGVPVMHRRGQMDNKPPDFYDLTVEPRDGAVGAIDLVVGPPGAIAGQAPPLARPLPPDPVIPFGVQTVAPGQFLQLDTGSAPDATVGLSIRPVPVPLVQGPLLATIEAGNTLSVPVALAPGGSLVVTELGVGPIPFGQQDAGQVGRTNVVIPVSDHPRTVALSWRRDERALPPIPAPPPEGQVAAVEAGTPVFLNLRDGEERGFALTVPQGGLFRVETLGRLHTAARLATPFIPKLAEADGNGVGQNMLIQSALRAGRYRVDVRAMGSSGHLGLVASTTPMLAGGTLLPGGSVRATLSPGSGVAFPVQVAGGPDDRYHFDVLSLGQPWTGRLEDSEGWPVVTPGALDGMEPVLRPGSYRLVVTPDSVGRQVVARLTAITKPVEITGHGPHALPFEAQQHATWREPDGKDQPRAPDVWSFSLAGPADISLKLTDGMVGVLHHTGDAGQVARLVRRWTGSLPAGDYQLDATSLGRNDRLGYDIMLSSPALQPGTPRSVTLPGSVPFTLAAARVVSLTSWGTTPVKATLHGEDGTVVARYRARPDDWNIAASRLLPAGRYTLNLDSAAPPTMGPSSASSDTSDSADSSEDSSDSSNAPDGDDQVAQTAATEGAGRTKPNPASQDVSSSDDTSDSDNGPSVEVRLELPPALPASQAPAQTAELSGNGVHVLTLPQPDPGSLVLAQASAAATTVLALERQDGDGWRTVAIDTGRSPVVAAPADGGPAAWRLETWTVDGGADPIRLAARAVTVDGQAPGSLRLATLDGMPTPLALARMHIDAPGIVAMTPAHDVLAGGWPGHALAPAGAAAVVVGTDLWLVSPRAEPFAAKAQDYQAGHALALTLASGLEAALPAMPVQDGQLQLWRADSGSDQPDLGPGAGMAPGSSVALGTAPLSLRGGADTTRFQLSRIAVKLAAPQPLAATPQMTLAPGAALPVTLPPGGKTLQLDLAPNVAAFAGWQGQSPVAVWGAGAAVSRTLTGPWTDVLLVNTGADAAPARLAAQPGPDAVTLVSGTVMKRFFGADGSFDLPFDAPAGARLVAAGDASLMTVTAAGTGRGTAVPVSGAGRAIVQHGAGALAVWLDVPGRSPWPDPVAQAMTLPAHTTLAGPAMALSFTADVPMLLHVSTTAPVLVGLQQTGRSDMPELFAAGAELHRVVAPGPVTLRLFSADDGPLSGTMAAWAEPLVSLGEGLGEQVAVGPGSAAAFSFTLAKAATIGVGVRALPDRVSARLLDASGKVVGEGVAQLRALSAGAYVLEARVPPDATPTVLRPALIGITPRPNGPPPDVVQSYLELVGMKPQGTP